jgi:hypothetical protein
MWGAGIERIAAGTEHKMNAVLLEEVENHQVAFVKSKDFVDWQFRV